MKCVEGRNQKYWCFKLKGIFFYIGKPEQGMYSLLLDPQTMKNEGLKPQKYMGYNP